MFHMYGIVKDIGLPIYTSFKRCRESKDRPRVIGALNTPTMMIAAGSSLAARGLAQMLASHVARVREGAAGFHEGIPKNNRAPAAGPTLLFLYIKF
jgi:hypothetical protein